MTEEILKMDIEVKSASSKRPTSLITRIPPEIKKIMDIEKGTILTWKVMIEDGKKYIEICKKTD